MFACIQGADPAVTLHRTYLRDGGKLAALDAKKVLSAGISARGPACSMRPRTGDQRRYRDRHRFASGDRQTGLGRAQRRQPGEAVAAGHGAMVTIYADNDADGDFAGPGPPSPGAPVEAGGDKRPVGGRCAGVSCQTCRHRLGPTSGANAWTPRQRPGVRHSFHGRRCGPSSCCTRLQRHCIGR